MYLKSHLSFEVIFNPEEILFLFFEFFKAVFLFHASQLASRLALAEMALNLASVFSVFFRSVLPLLHPQKLMVTRALLSKISQFASLMSDQMSHQIFIRLKNGENKLVEKAPPNGAENETTEARCSFYQSL